MPALTTDPGLWTISDWQTGSFCMVQGCQININGNPFRLDLPQGPVRLQAGNRRPALSFAISENSFISCALEQNREYEDRQIGQASHARLVTAAPAW